jgi:hypothetical protein
MSTGRARKKKITSKDFGWEEALCGSRGIFVQNFGNIKPHSGRTFHSKCKTTATLHHIPSSQVKMASNVCSRDQAAKLNGYVISID